MNTETKTPPPKQWAAAPPNHRCPYCTSPLTAEEIKNGECWACQSSLTQGFTTEKPDLNPN
jgi:hypothetical protein